MLYLFYDGIFDLLGAIPDVYSLSFKRLKGIRAHLCLLSSNTCWTIGLWYQNVWECWKLSYSNLCSLPLSSNFAHRNVRMPIPFAALCSTNLRHCSSNMGHHTTTTQRSEQQNLFVFNNEKKNIIFLPELGLANILQFLCSRHATSAAFHGG